MSGKDLRTVVESALNSCDAVTLARVKSAQAKDDGTISLEIEAVTADDTRVEKPAREKVDGGIEAMAKRVGSVTAEQETRERTDERAKTADTDESTDANICGAETASGDPCQFTPGYKCPHHDGGSDARGDNNAGESEDGDDGPNGAAEHVREFGPCVAAADRDSETPCGYGANGDGARFCQKHGGIAGPSLSRAAMDARAKWDDDESIEAFIEEYVS